MLYDSFQYHADVARTEWLRSGVMRHNSSYRIFVVCLAGAAPRIEQALVASLKSRGADVRVSSTPAASKDGSRARMVFAVQGSGNVRGAIAALVNQLSSDPQVRSVRWESDPRPA